MSLRRAKHLVRPIPCFLCKSGAGRRFRRVALTGLLLLGAAVNAAAQPAQKQVLVLQSFDRGNLFSINFTAQLPRRSGPARRNDP